MFSPYRWQSQLTIVSGLASFGLLRHPSIDSNCPLRVVMVVVLFIIHVLCIPLEAIHSPELILFVLFLLSHIIDVFLSSTSSIAGLVWLHLLRVNVRDVIAAFLVVLIPVIIILAIIIGFLSRARVHAHEAIFVFFRRALVFIVGPLRHLTSESCILSSQEVSVYPTINLGVILLLQLILPLLFLWDKVVLSLLEKLFTFLNESIVLLGQLFSPKRLCFDCYVIDLSLQLLGGPLYVSLKSWYLMYVVEFVVSLLTTNLFLLNASH